MDENKTTEEVKNESVEAQSKETAPVAAEAVEAQAQVAESERPAPATKAEVLERLKIGIASCMERVCLYV